MLKRIKSIIKIEMKMALTEHDKLQRFNGNDLRKEKKGSIFHISSAKENTDKGNKLQLQHEVKRCKEAHANIYC